MKQPATGRVRYALCKHVLLLFLAGCAARWEGEYVRKVRFVGNETPGVGDFFNPQSDAVLRTAILQSSGVRPTLLRPRQQPTLLDPALLAEDAWRLETWYAHHGYFDARFLGWEIRRTNSLRKRRPIVVVGHVEPGQPSLVRSIQWEGLGDGILARQQDNLERAAELVVGDPFNLDLYEEALDIIALELRNRSYAYATVQGRVEVRPNEHAVDLFLTVEPGPPCHFGPISVRFEGEHRLDPERLKIELPFTACEEKSKSNRDQFLQDCRYSVDALADARSRLYALRAFSVVNVVPDLRDPTQTEVPVTITVREGQSRQLKVGANVAVEPAETSLFLAGDYQEYNVFNKLWSLHSESRAGEAAVVNLNEAFSEDGEVLSNTGPVGLQVFTLDMRRAFGPNLGMVHTVSAEHGVESEYWFVETAAAPTLKYTRDFRYDFQLGFQFGYRITYQYPYNPTTVLSPYLLSMLEQQVIIDRRADKINTDRGWYVSLGLAEAGLGGDFSFLRTEAEGRRWFSGGKLMRWNQDLTLALRLGGGYIYPFGPKAGVPYDEQFFLGGGTTVRGWLVDHLGPEPGIEEETKRCLKKDNCDEDLLPGGLLSSYANIELRQPIGWDVSLVGFVDGGRVWDGLLDVAGAPPLWSAGGGFRYATPVGPVRLDLAWRLDNPPEYADEPGFIVHFGLSEAF